MNAKKLLTVTVIVAITTMFALASNLTSLSMNVMLIIPKTALAQVPPAPFLPNGGDLTTDNQLPDNQLPDTNTQSQLPQPTTPTAANIPPPTIQITSHQDGSQVPVGELTIQGTSSDNQESNCQVYADVNDIAPLQNATAAGVNGGDDYSQWTFTYAQDYQLITQGVNELTAKISCFDNVGGSGAAAIPLSEWHSVNVTGVAGGAITTPTTTITPSPSPIPSPTMTQTPSASALGAEQGATNIPSTIASTAAPFATPEEPSTASNQGVGGGDDDDGDDDGDDDDGDDDDGDDDDGDDGDDDDDEGDDG